MSLVPEGLGPCDVPVMPLVIYGSGIASGAKLTPATAKYSTPTDARFNPRMTYIATAVDISSAIEIANGPRNLQKRSILRICEFKTTPLRLATLLQANRQASTYSEVHSHCPQQLQQPAAHQPQISTPTFPTTITTEEMENKPNPSQQQSNSPQKPTSRNTPTSPKPPSPPHPQPTLYQPLRPHP